MSGHCTLWAILRSLLYLLDLLACWKYNIRPNYGLHRSSRLEVSYKKGVLKIFAKSHKSTSARVSFLIKLQASDCNFIKKRLRHKCFLVNSAKFLRTPFLWNTSGGCFWFQVYHVSCTDHFARSMSGNILCFYWYYNVSFFARIIYFKYCKTKQ